MISSFDQNPAKGGMPARAREPITNVQNVRGIGFLSPPISLMLFEWTAWITEPAPRNSSALKKAWVNRWNIAAVWPAGPRPRAAIMYPSWDTVEYASTRLMSSWTSASSAAISIVVPPMKATNVRASGEGSNTANMRATRYTPAATMVAAWISADTGVGPAMASGSQTWSGN